MENQSNTRLPSSFRDPSGYVFLKDSRVYRKINASYVPVFNHMQSTGIFSRLFDSGLLCPHSIIETNEDSITIQPREIPFISYPYEWCFSQLKDAARCTLRLQKLALENEMSLKDASAYNIQFADGKPVLIDSLSFEQFSPGQPWTAYHQFCRHFLAPLALMSYTNVNLHRLLMGFIDGIPLDLAVSILPLRAFLRPSLFLHLYLHSRFSLRYTGVKKPQSSQSFSRNSAFGLLDSLQSAVNTCRLRPAKSMWSGYYGSGTHSEEYLRVKEKIVSDLITYAKPDTVWDLGANTGRFAKLSAGLGYNTIAFDSDPLCVESLYRDLASEENYRVLPLVCDLTNPSPSLGFNNQERDSLTQRGPTGLVMALALIHHIAIGNNVPFTMISSYLARLGRWLILEFVPKDDPQVKEMLAVRRDIFTEYTRECLLKRFSADFLIHKEVDVGSSGRTIFLMEKR
ncbi:MAG: SAM-dependent methyltransferase [Fibrobacter sp.]|nr:SAM-dependent methyltransferase [Fibrobacter sp.]